MSFVAHLSIFMRSSCHFENEAFPSTNTYSAFRLSIPTSGLTNGKHKILIEVSGGTWEKEASFTFQLYDVNVPKLSDAKFFYTNWFSLKNMEEKHQVERWTEAWYVVLRNYASHDGSWPSKFHHHPRRIDHL